MATGQDNLRTELEQLADLLQEIAGNGHPNKLFLLFKARDGGVPTSFIDEHAQLRNAHVERLKNQGFLLEADCQYKLTPFGAAVMSEVDNIYGTVSQTSVDTRGDLLEFLRLAGWDEDLRTNWKVFADSTIVSKHPMTKFNTLIQSARAVKTVTNSITLPDTYYYRIHEAGDLDPRRVEFVYTPPAQQAVIDSESTFDMAKENERAGVTYRFLDSSTPQPNYNLTLVDIDKQLVQELRAPTQWLTEFNLTNWLVVLDVESAGKETDRLLVSDGVRDWACGEDGIYHQYKSVSKEDSWNNPEDILAESLLEK